MRIPHLSYAWPSSLADAGTVSHSCCTLLTDQGHHAETATLALYSLHGFHPNVLDAAARRQDVLLVDLDALYGDGPTRGLQ